ncbi:hypothetical protein C8Q77DRAFT_1277681 [Trametes polyzona]|nr:hypothetical protein C8Q77DRAFT_1277681 [Trametes polyzona]
MHAAYSVIYSLVAASVVLCAPMASLDADAFLQNGQEAQALNAAFAKLKPSDACNSGEMACIGASIAHCVNSTWKEEACYKSLFCFALPSVREEGTTLSCTSNTTALSVIRATGVTGGIAANSTKDTVDFPMDCNDDDEEDEGEDDDDDSQSTSVISGSTTRTSSSASQTASLSTTTAFSSSSTPSETANDASRSVVTVTVTAIPTSFSTDFSETTTLDRSQASSFLSSIETDTNFSIVTTIRGSAPTASASATASVTSAAQSESTVLSSKPVGIASAPAFTSDVGAATTITLLGGPKATTSLSSSSATARATSAAAIDVGDSYY